MLYAINIQGKIKEKDRRKFFGVVLRGRHVNT